MVRSSIYCSKYQLPCQHEFAAFAMEETDNAKASIDRNILDAFDDAQSPISRYRRRVTRYRARHLYVRGVRSLRNNRGADHRLAGLFPNRLHRHTWLDSRVGAARQSPVDL